MVAAPAYDTGPPAFTVPLPLFAAMCRRQVELARQVEDYRQREAGTRAYLNRGDIEPGPKVLYLLTAHELGIAPGSKPNTERPHEWKTIVHPWLSKTTGMSKEAIGSWLDAAVEDKNPTPLFRRRRVIDPAVSDEYQVYQYAPPEGSVYQQTWGTPATMPVPDTNRRRQKQKDKAKDKAEENRKILAKAEEIIKTLHCVHCGHEGADLYAVCCHCGASTDVSALVGTRLTPPRKRKDLPDELSSSRYTNSHTSSNREVDDDSSPTPPETQGETPATPAPEEALAAAMAVLAPAFLPFPNHIIMTGKAEPKYLTGAGPLAASQLPNHLVGTATYGGGLCWDDPTMQSGRAARGIAWDSDEDLGRLLRAGNLLRRRGLRPLVVKNPTKPNSGHLFLFFDGDVDPTDAQARAEQIAPCLREVPERFPNPKVKGGHRIRLPGGCYLPVGGPPVPVLVGLAPEVGAPDWAEGTTPAGWAAIAAAVTHAPDLLVTWVDPTHRPATPKRTETPVAPSRATATGGADFFRTFNAEHRIDEMVRVNCQHKFKSPFRSDTTPSAHYYAKNGSWCDFSGGERRGGDAFDLWCALNGYWPDGADKPDRKGAYRHLCPKEDRS